MRGRMLVEDMELQLHVFCAARIPTPPLHIARPVPLFAVPRALDDRHLKMQLSLR